MNIYNHLPIPVMSAFFAALFVTACSDETENMESSNRIMFTSDIQNSWTSSEAGKKDNDTPPAVVSTLQTNGIKPLYLHTLYADSIASYSADDSVPTTRATPISTNNMYDTFGVSAYTYIDNWDNTKASNYMYDIAVSKAGNSWSPSSTHYWPGSSYKMKFFAYAPKSNDAYRLSDKAAGVPTITCTVPDDVSKQQDLLVAASEEINGGSNTAVNLTFHHALTAVKFVCGNDMKAGVVKSVTLKNVNSTGTYNFETKTWNNIGTPKDFSQTLNKNSTGTANEVITEEPQTFMMIPQTLPEKATIEVIFNDGTNDYTLTCDIANSVWEIGKTVTYKLSTTSINWEYVLTVNGPKDFIYTGGTKPYNVTSYRKNTKGTTEPTKWTTQFSTDEGKTWSEDKPEWLTAFATTGEGSVSATIFGATVSAQTGTPDNKHAEILQKKPEKGMSAVPYNLSNKTGSDPVENTANCYVVDAPGYYSFPLVYGNAIKNSSTNSLAYTSKAFIKGYYDREILKTFINHLGNGITDPYIVKNSGCIPAKAELIWQDAPSLITDIKYNQGSDDKGGNISFKVDKNTIQQGNAVIAIKDAGNNVLWSWHIWVTDEDINDVMTVTNFTSKTNDFMKVNLGWCDGIPMTYAERTCKVRFTSGELTRDITISQADTIIISNGNHPYYNWGRKDPLRPSDGISGPKTCYNSEGVSFATLMPLEDFGTDITCIKNYILKPDIMPQSLSGDACYRNLWDVNNVQDNFYYYKDTTIFKKTIYDPCPVGFRVPPADAYTGFSKTGTGSVRDQNINGSLDQTTTTTTWSFYTGLNETGQTILFPALGHISNKSNYSGFRYFTFYWTTLPRTPNTGNALVLTASSLDPSFFPGKGQGCSIRPVKE